MRLPVIKFIYSVVIHHPMLLQVGVRLSLDRSDSMHTKVYACYFWIEIMAVLHTDI